MSLLDDVSIVVTPNGYKAGELYAVIPSNGDADMDVTRATAATRVDEDGLVNYTEVIGAEEVTNGDFSNGLTDWTENGGSYATIVSGALNSNNSDAGNWYAENISQNVSFVNGTTYKLTFKAKNISGNLNLRITQGANAMASLDLTSTFVDYTYFYTANADNGSIRIFCNSAVGQFEIDNISVKEVTRDNVPRIDYTGGGCPHILAEPQRTNLFEYSESFNESEWSRTSVTVVDNSSQSPDGTNNASLLYPSSSGDYRYMHNSTTASSSTYTISAFVKASGKNVVWFYINSASNNGFIYYDLSDQTTQVVAGSVGTPTATIISYGNDWYKISFTTGTAVALASGSGIGVSDAKGDPAVTTNGTDGVLVWGLQLEAGSYATSYIPTSGSTVTRNQDIFTRDGIGSLINSTEGVLFVEMAALSDDSTNRQLTLSDGSDTNRIVLKYDNQSNIIQSFNRVSGVETASLSATVSDITQFSKIAIKYKLNDYAMWIDGVEVDTDNTSTTFPSSTLNKLSFGTSSSLFGKVRQLQVYKTALTDTQLAALTS